MYVISLTMILFNLETLSLLLIASTKWTEPFTDLLLCLFDHKYNSNQDFLVDYTVSELAV